MRRTPAINTRGIFQLQSPFVADPTTIYITHAIRSFQDLEERFIDPFKAFYEPNGLSRSVFEDDRQANAAIITLIEEGGGEVLYVPDTYILAYPDMGEVDYQRIILTVDFGALPSFLDFSATKTQIGDIAADVIGKAADVTVHIAPSSGTVTPDEHQTLESARLANISRNETWRGLYLQQLNANTALQAKIDTLEQILIDNNFFQ